MKCDQCGIRFTDNERVLWCPVGLCPLTWQRSPTERQVLFYNIPKEHSPRGYKTKEDAGAPYRRR